MIRRVTREITEAAENYLHATYLDHLQAASLMTPVRGRVIRTTTVLGAYDAEAASRQGCFLRLISVVEAYVDLACDALFREKAPTANDLVRRLVEGAELRASTTWQERRDAFERYHNIRLGTLARWSELDAGIEVRNAIAHGLGQLTPRQRRSAAARKIHQIGVSSNDGRLLITEASLKQCRDVCVAFILSLDNAMPLPKRVSKP
jgi:hypothetical protein